jgi:hypothetical protein
MTIHITGHSAKTAPSAAAASARPAGIFQTITATASATPSPASAACQAGRLSTPSMMSRVAIGSNATAADSARLSPTGVRSWWNMPAYPASGQWSVITVDLGKFAGIAH